MVAEMLKSMSGVTGLEVGNTPDRSLVYDRAGTGRHTHMHTTNKLHN